jgi:hypothetical protein
MTLAKGGKAEQMTKAIMRHDATKPSNQAFKQSSCLLKQYGLELKHFAPFS